MEGWRDEKGRKCAATIFWQLFLNDFFPGARHTDSGEGTCGRACGARADAGAQVRRRPDLQMRADWTSYLFFETRTGHSQYSREMDAPCLQYAFDRSKMVILLVWEVYCAGWVRKLIAGRWRAAAGCIFGIRPKKPLACGFIERNSKSFLLQVIVTMRRIK